VAYNTRKSPEKSPGSLQELSRKSLGNIFSDLTGLVVVVAILPIILPEGLGELTPNGFLLIFFRSCSTRMGLIMGLCKYTGYWVPMLNIEGLSLGCI
jgi:hypothetical protein